VKLNNSAAIINSTLYYFGGRNSTYSGFPTLYSLSLTSPFSNTTANSELWRSKSSLPYGVSECVSWTWNGKLWQEGGIIGAAQLADAGTELNTLPNSVLMYDPVADTWSVPSLPTRPVIQRRLHAAVMNEIKGIVYIVGGTSDIYTGTTTCNNGTGEQCLQSQPYALDLNQSVWMSLSSVGAPMVWKHAMVLISNDIIYVIGGDGVTLASIPTYNTITDKWSQLIPVGPSPSPRTGCTAVVHPDNVTIIMYGGWDRLTDPSIAAPKSDLWAFDTSTNVWKQIIDSGATPVTFQASVIVNDQMFVMFGSTQNNATLEGTRTFFFINVTNGQILADYRPSTTTPSSNPSTSTVSTNTTPSPNNPIQGSNALPELINSSILASVAIIALVIAALVIYFVLKNRRTWLFRFPIRPIPPIHRNFETTDSSSGASDIQYIGPQKPQKPEQKPEKVNKPDMRYDHLGRSMRQNQSQGSSVSSFRGTTPLTQKSRQLA
ncbi:hypothetical protein BC937DRAFT_95112, partial [Endogone sp. FLAS-F59071]